MTWYHSETHGMINLDKFNSIGIEYNLVGYMRQPVVTAQRTGELGKVLSRAILTSACPDETWARFFMSWLAEMIGRGCKVIKEQDFIIILEENQGCEKDD